MKDIIIVTGGCSGLGYQLVKQAIDRGYFVANLARNKAKMAQMDLLFKENYKGFVGDVSDDKFVIDSINQINQLGNIMCLINNAEKGSFKKPTEYNIDDINSCLSGLKGMILCSTETLKIKQEKDLKIVNIMSSAALKGNKNEAMYCATKWAERGYSESLKAYYKGSSVKIISIYPGGMNTQFWDDNRNYVSKEKSDSFMKPEDVAKVILDNVLNYQGLNVADIVIERNS